MSEQLSTRTLRRPAARAPTRIAADLTAEGLINRRHSATGTLTFQYDQVRLSRWIERQVDAAGIDVLLGAVVTEVGVCDGRLTHVDVATRFGPARIAAVGYVDASGDASLTCEAGFEVREPDAAVYGSLNFLIEAYDVEAAQHLGRGRAGALGHSRDGAVHGDGHGGRPRAGSRRRRRGLRRGPRGPSSCGSPTIWTARIEGRGPNPRRRLASCSTAAGGS